MNQPSSSNSTEPSVDNRSDSVVVGTTPDKQSNAGAPARGVAESFVQATDSLDKRSLGKPTMMADGTWRTANHAIVEPDNWKYKHTWYAKLYRSLHRRYLRLTLRWPSWVPRAVGMGLVLIVAINLIVLAAYTSQKQVEVERGDSLPAAGIIPADGSKYFVSEAQWRYGGESAGWAIRDNKDKTGKAYASSDGTCTVQVVEKSTQSDGITLELLTSLTMEAYASPVGQARAQVDLPEITIASTQGAQQFAFVRSRYVFNQEDGNRVVEIANRTLGKESFSIIQECSQADWDQSQPARDQLLNNLAITAS